MKSQMLLIIFLLTTLIIYGQQLQEDTFLTKLSSTKIIATNEDFLRASKGAESYLKSLLGDTLYKSHIKLNFKQTNKANFQMYFGTTFHSKLLQSPTYYNIHYFLLDRTDTLSYFNLLVDTTGKPIAHDKYFSFSSPEKLILGYKNLFPNKFKIDFKKAIEVGKKHGFQNQPFLNYKSEEKKGFYWTFLRKYDDGKRKFMELNAKTGFLESEMFFCFDGRRIAVIKRVAYVRFGVMQANECVFVILFASIVDMAV